MDHPCGCGYAAISLELMETYSKEQSRLYLGRSHMRPPSTAPPPRRRLPLPPPDHGLHASVEGGDEDGDGEGTHPVARLGHPIDSAPTDLPANADGERWHAAAAENPHKSSVLGTFHGDRGGGEGGEKGVGSGDGTVAQKALCSITAATYTRACLTAPSPRMQPLRAVTLATP